MSRPDYVRFGGCPVGELPVQMYNSNSYLFMIKGKLANLQNLVDQTLNTPFDNKCQLKVVSEYVTFMFHEAKTRSIPEPYSYMGQFDELNIVALIMVVGMDGKKRRFFVNSSHYWVANMFALINGRDLVGCNKIACQYEMPKHDQLPERFSCTIEAFHPMGTEAWMKPYTLFECNIKHPGNEINLLQPEGMTRLHQFLQEDEDLFIGDEQDKAFIIEQMLQPSADLLMFKQFPDGKGEKAVYQALTCAAFEHETIHTAKLLLHDYEFISHHIESYQLSDFFGIEPGVHKPKLAIQVIGDCVYHIPNELAEVM